jgi:hypothetical protein
MHTQRLLAFGILENVHCIVWIYVHTTEQMAWGVCTDGDQSQIKWPTELTDLFESWADGEIVFGIVIVFALG